MKHGKSDLLNLFDIFDFQPMVTPEDWVQINTNKSTLLEKQNNIKNELLRIAEQQGVDFLRSTYQKDFRELETQIKGIEQQIANLKKNLIKS